MGKTNNIPYYQGSLDGLCAIYACINCIGLLLDNDVNCTELFASVVNSVDNKLADFVLNGITPKELEQNVLKLCVRYLAKQQIVLSYTLAKANRLNNYWSLMQDHYETHGEGSIILSISGSYEHWSCVRNITPRCITLADSHHLNRLYRAKVTVAEPNKQRIHTLVPKETYLLSVSSRISI